MNRPASGKRSAPSARDWREITTCVALADGTYTYAPHAHALQRLTARDLRPLTGQQDFIATAECKIRYVAAGAGFIAQNVYLFCAASGLGTVVRGSVDRTALGGALGLAAHQQIVLAQGVGYPK